MGARTSAAVAATLWGCTYIVSTALLPPHPFTVAAVRALGGAAVLLLFVRHLPPRSWWGRVVVLGTLNAGLFFALLFVAALRLPGGVAAIFQALGPLTVILLGWAILHARPTLLKITSVLMGAAGVSLVVLKGPAALDVVGVLAALGAVASLSLGGVLMSKWGKPPMPLIAFTGWQLLVAGAELLLLALLASDLPADITTTHLAGFMVLAVLLTAIPFALWFKAMERLGAVTVSPFLLLSPVTAFVLDALVKGLVPTALQLIGVATVVAGLLLSQWTPRGRTNSNRASRASHPSHALRELETDPARPQLPQRATLARPTH